MSSDTRIQRELSCAPHASMAAFGAALLVGALGFAGGAAAQVQQPGIVQNAPGQVQTPPEVAKPNEPLSDTLSRSQGVVTPPAADIDPGIHAPAPEPNPQTTPVIPPPGTPGGNPNIQPK